MRYLIFVAVAPDAAEGGLRVLGDPYAPAVRPVRPHSLVGGPASLAASLELIDRYKGWLLEQIRALREENAAIAGGHRLVLKRDADAAWEDATAAVLAGNKQVLARMASLVIAMDEEDEELASTRY